MFFLSPTPRYGSPYTLLSCVVYQWLPVLVVRLGFRSGGGQPRGQWLLTVGGKNDG